MSNVYESVKKGIEEAINDAKGAIKLKRDTVEYNDQKIYRTEAPCMHTVRQIDNQIEREKE